MSYRVAFTILFQIILNLCHEEITFHKYFVIINVSFLHTFEHVDTFIISLNSAAIYVNGSLVHICPHALQGVLLYINVFKIKQCPRMFPYKFKFLLVKRLLKSSFVYVFFFLISLINNLFRSQKFNLNPIVLLKPIPGDLDLK